MGETDAGGHQHSSGQGGGDRLEAQGESALARFLMDGMDGGDLDIEHAAQHVAGAVGRDPGLPEGYEALAQLTARAGGVPEALALFPEARRHTGTLACRAALLAAAGCESDAVLILSQVMAAVPRQPWAGVAWLARPGLAEALDPVKVAMTVANVTQAIDDPVDETVRAAFEPYYTLVKAVVARHPENLHLVSMASSLARRMDELDTAIAWARSAQHFYFEPTGDALGAVMLGSALRRAGRVEEAIELWRATCRADPSQTYLAVDLAEFLAAEGRPQEGISILEQVLAREPEHEKAGPAIHGLRYEITPDASHLLALYEHFKAHPDHDYAEYLLHTRCSGAAWLGRTDTATEATTNAARQVIERFGPGYSSRVHLQLSGIEPPSAALAAHLSLPALEITVAQVGNPDPRLPVRAVETVVWRFEETTAYPAVPVPSDKALALVCTVATARWDFPPDFYERAAALGDLPVSDLLGLLVHPPAPEQARWPDDLAAKAPDVWVRAVQALACLWTPRSFVDNQYYAANASVLSNIDSY